MRLAARRLSLGRAWDILDTLAAALTNACPSLESLTAAGDVRRYEPLVSSLILVASSTDPPAALDCAGALAGLAEVRDRSARGATLVFRDVEVDLRDAAPD